MAQKIDKEEFNKDLNRYVSKVSKSNSRFINLREFIKKEQNHKKENIEPELIELKEKTGLSLYWSKFLNFFKSEEKELDEENLYELEDNIDVTEEISETEELMVEEDDEIAIHKSKPCFFEKLFGKKYDNNELKQINEELIKDMKAISVFAKELLDLIPKEELENLKIDGTLDDFKFILKKNNLLKK
jgi:hypothetical protein